MAQLLCYAQKLLVMKPLPIFNSIFFVIFLSIFFFYRKCQQANQLGIDIPIAFLSLGYCRYVSLLGQYQPIRLSCNIVYALSDADRGISLLPWFIHFIFFSFFSFFFFDDKQLRNEILPEYWTGARHQSEECTDFNNTSFRQISRALIVVMHVVVQLLSTKTLIDREHFHCSPFRSWCQKKKYSALLVVYRSMFVW